MWHLLDGEDCKRQDNSIISRNVKANEQIVVKESVRSKATRRHWKSSCLLTKQKSRWTEIWEDVSLLQIAGRKVGSILHWLQYNREMRLGWSGIRVGSRRWASCLLEGPVDGNSMSRRSGSTSLHYWPQDKRGTRNNSARCQCLSLPWEKLKKWNDKTE